MHFKVSVIIPVYNAEEYIEHTVNSAINQEEVEEVILVEDRSTDSSYLICKKLAKNPKVKLYEHPNNINKGASASRNLGINKASQNFIAFLDADDYYLPDRFKKTKEVFEKHNDADGVFELIVGKYVGNNIETRQRLDNHPSTFLDDVEPEKLFFELYPIGKGRGYFNADGLVVKKTIFDKVGYFDEDMETAEDLLMWCKMTKVGRFYPGERNRPIAIFRRHDGESLTTNRKIVLGNFVKFSDKILDFAAPHLNNEQKLLFIDRYYYMQIFYQEVYEPKNLKEYSKRLKIFIYATNRIISKLGPKYIFNLSFLKQFYNILKFKPKN